MTLAQVCCLVCGVLTPRQLLPSPNEAVAARLPKHLLFVGGSPMPIFAHGCGQHLTIATRHGMY